MLTQEQYERCMRLVQELEATELEFGAGQLRDGNRFCVLGIACNLYDSSRWMQGNSYQVRDGNRRAMTTQCPVDVAEYYGFPQRWEASEGFMIPVSLLRKLGYKQLVRNILLAVEGKPDYVSLNCINDVMGNQGSHKAMARILRAYLESIAADLMIDNKE